MHMLASFKPITAKANVLVISGVVSRRLLEYINAPSIPFLVALFSWLYHFDYAYIADFESCSIDISILTGDNVKIGGNCENMILDPGSKWQLHYLTLSSIHLL